MAGKKPHPLVAEAVDRLMAEFESDVQAVVAMLQGGDFETDAARPSKAEYQEMLWTQWPDQKFRAERSRALTPRVDLEEALDTLAPDLDTEARELFFELIENGVPYLEAVSIADQMHRAKAQIADPLAVTPVEPQMPMAPPPPPLMGGM